jgi:hypothetical protein
MTFKKKIKKLQFRLDQLSPYPRMYEFIMSKNEKVIFDEAIKESRHYLEFGLGGSTLRALLKSKARIYTVESSLEWLNYMRKYMIVWFFEKNDCNYFL